MDTREYVAMILAGGRGERLGTLTHYYSKPAVYFGGKYRIIDFTINNCRNSGIDTVGILSQYFNVDLNEYVKKVYCNQAEHGGFHVLPSGFENLYKGTADSVYKNFAFIEQYSPEYVLVLASDHIYRMDYKKLIAFHQKKGADVTIASTAVPWAEASGLGIINAGAEGCVLGFEEKPLHPKSNLASMGIYVFNWSTLKKYLPEDSKCSYSKHDFGGDILPKMLLSGCRLYTYQFNDYWRDVGTVNKLWESNMEQLDNPALLHLMDSEWDICKPYKKESSNYLSDKALVSQSILSGDCSISGCVKHSILSNSVTVGQGAEIINSVIMPNVYIGRNARVCNTIVGPHASVADETEIGADYGSDFFVDRQVCAGGVSLISPWAHVQEGMAFQKSSHISEEKLINYYSSEVVRPKLSHRTVKSIAI